ncbi:MAG: DnaJ domain-containing protein [Candidatus Sericytochromatia bacterium]|nr:DnaJ domain-containing protein [Candidatus Sericytochromatia bacterium]
MNKVNEPNYYQLLNILNDAEQKEVVQAYHDICEKFCIFPYSSEEEISQINPEMTIYKKAYTTLSNSEKRKNYDQHLNFLIEQKNRKQSNYNKIVSDTSNLEELIPFAFGLESVKELSFSEAKENINEYLFSKAKEALNCGDYHSSINMFRKLINIKNEAQYHSYLALALTKKGWIAYAQEEFRIALEINPNDHIAKENIEIVSISHDKTKITSKLDGSILSEEIEIKKSFFSKIKEFFSKEL